MRNLSIVTALWMSILLLTTSMILKSALAAEPVRLAAILTFATESDGKSGMGAEKCVPVQFELQEDGSFQAHLAWTRNFGQAPHTIQMTATFDIYQVLDNGLPHYAYTAAFSCNRSSEKSGNAIASPLNLMNHHFISSSCGEPGHSARVGVMFKRLGDAEWCGGHAG